MTAPVLNMGQSICTCCQYFYQKKKKRAEMSLLHSPLDCKLLVFILGLSGILHIVGSQLIVLDVCVQWSKNYKYNNTNELMYKIETDLQS